MTVDLLEKRLQDLDVQTPDAGRVSTKVLARQSRRRALRLPRVASVPVGAALIVVLVAYFVPAADLAIADRAPWSADMLRMAGLVGAKDRITVVSTTASSSGYTFTLQGAYADDTRTVLLIHSHPAAMPDGLSTLTDQFARSYMSTGGALNTQTGDMALSFEPLAWPDSITGARITLHVSGVSQMPPENTTSGTWELTATVSVDVSTSLPVPASGDLGPAHFRFTAAKYTPATVEVDGEVTGVSPDDLGRMVPGNGGKEGPALQIFILDPNGNVINGTGATEGNLGATSFRVQGFRTTGPGRYIVRVSYYGYGSFDRTLTIPT